MKTKRSARSVAVVVPAHNEELNIVVLYKELKKAFGKLPVDNWKVIFVNDGSQDKTLEEVKKLVRNGKVEYISFSKNHGHQIALKAGLDHVVNGYDLAITMDADLQHPPELLPELIKRWEQGYDIVYTIRESTKESSLLKNATSSLFYRLFRRLTRIELESGAADFKLYDKKVLSALNLYTESNLFLRGIVATIGFRQIGIPYKANPRRAGDSSYSYRKMFGLALDGVTSFSTIPLKLAVLIGSLFSILSILYGLYALLAWALSNHAAPGWASIAAGISFIGGLQLLFLGIIGIYIGKIFDEVKGRPMYIIEETNIGKISK